MEKVTLEGVELELEMTDGVLTVYRDGAMEGSMLIIEPEPEPEPVEVIVAPPPAAIGLPDGWYYDGDDRMMMNGRQDENGNWYGGHPVNTEDSLHQPPIALAEGDGSGE